MTNEKFSFVNLGEEKIRFIQKGTGRDILLIHGMPGSIEDWKEIIGPLSENYRVTAFDRLGHGHSSANNYSYHIRDNAEMVENLIKKLKLNNPFVIGHSYGGSIVAFLAANSQNKNIEYMIIDSPLYGYETELKFKLVALPFVGKILAFLASLTIANKEIKNGVSVLFSSFEKEKVNELVAERQKIWSQPKVIYTKSKESLYYGNDLSILAKKYATIKAKIFLVTAEKFLGTYGDDCAKFHAEVENSNLTVLKNTGHYIQLEKPIRLVQIILKAMKY